MITPPYIVWYHPVFFSSSHPTNILVFVLVGFLVAALDGQLFCLLRTHIVTSIFRFCWFFLSDQSPIALSLCVFSLPPWQTAGQFRQDNEPGGYNNSDNDNNNDHHDDNTNHYYLYRRLASFVKILNQEDISKHQNHDTIQEVPCEPYFLWGCECAISFIFQVYFGKSFKLNHPKPYAMSLISKLAGVSCARIIILSQDFHFVDPNLYSSAPILISIYLYTAWSDKKQLFWLCLKSFLK